MCGICGILNFNTGDSPNEALLDEMCHSIRHRGPDDQGVFINGNVGLGVQRLAIIDIAGGHQPIPNEDNSVVVAFNGEVYNYQQLRRDLTAKGHRFKSSSDTEVIVHLYEEFGEDCPTKLNGIFAFAVWDAREQTLFIARDHLGVKPLYYFVDDRGLVFGSELKTILKHPRVKRDIDPFALDDFLTFRYVPAPRTIFRNVYKLPAGCWLKCADGKVVTNRYWDVTFDTSANQMGDEGDLAEQVRELLAESVRMQLMSDVPLGAFLSGGIDSSIIVGLMSAAMDGPVKTYSVGFRSWDQYDELKYARIVAQHFSTDHHEVIVDANIVELLPHLIAHFDEPMADPAAIPTYLISEAAREDVTVVLTGEGADELFCGYGWYRWPERNHFADKLRSLPSPAKAALLASVRHGFRGRRGKRRLMAALLPSFEDRYFDTIACSVFQKDERNKLYSDAFQRVIERKSFHEQFSYYLDHSKKYGEQERMQYLDTKIWLPGDPLTKVDRMSMAVSLEARVPFLDHRLVELAAKIPYGLKVKDGVAKYLLRRSMLDLLPKEIAEREKHAFDLPINEWLRHDLKEMIEKLPAHKLFSETEYFSRDHVEALVREHLAGHRQHGNGLWSLLILAQWYSEYIDRSSRG